MVIFQDTLEETIRQKTDFGLIIETIPVILNFLCGATVN